MMSSEYKLDSDGKPTYNIEKLNKVTYAELQMIANYEFPN